MNVIAYYVKLLQLQKNSLTQIVKFRVFFLLKFATCEKTQQILIQYPATSTTCRYKVWTKPDCALNLKSKQTSYTKPIFNFFELEKNVMKMNQCLTHCLYQSWDSVEIQIADGVI